MSRTLKSFILALVLVLVAGVSFLAGYGASQRTVSAAPAATRALPGDELSERFKLFWEALSWVEKEFYRPEAIDPTKITYGAIRGMLQTLGDQHTQFVDPQEQQISETQLRGGFEGIGVFVEMKADGKLRIVAPQEGSPGEKVGLKAGDVVTHADGKSLAGLTMVQAVSFIRGPKGTNVSLTVVREGSAEPLVFEVMRAEIKVESVRGKMLPQGVGYVRVSQFGVQTRGELVRVLQELLRERPKGLVLDLRSNPGGYLASAVEVASQFLSDGVVLHEVRANGDRREYRAKAGGLATETPLVVLMDRGSASAAEIVAGALQDHGRALLVGEKSFGKGSMQSVRSLSDGSSVHITIARWHTPKDRPIDGVGLTPDVAVSLSTEVAEGDDVQLQKAVDVLLGGQR